MASRDSQRMAFHLGKGRSFSSLAVDIDDELRNGPWQCSAEHCRIPLTFKPGFPRHIRKSGTTSLVSSHWVKAHHATPHASGCTAASTARSAGYHDTRLGTKVRVEDSMLLNFGVRKAVKKAPGEWKKDGQGTALDYAARVGTLGRLLQIFKQVGGHAAMRSYFFKHAGTAYRWGEIAYPSTRTDFQRLCSQINQNVHANETWPWIIWGKVAWVGAKGNSEVRRQLDIVPADGEGGTNIRVSGFFDKSDEFSNVERELTIGTNVVILLTPQIYPAMKFDGLLGSISCPADVVVLAE